MAGAEGWEDIEEFGKQKHGWLRKFLKLRGGIPSHDTISRAFQLAKAGVVQDAFSSWVAEWHKPLALGTVAILVVPFRTSSSLVATPFNARANPLNTTG